MPGTSFDVKKGRRHDSSMLAVFGFVGFFVGDLGAFLERLPNLVIRGGMSTIFPRTTQPRQREFHNLSVRSRISPEVPRVHQIPSPKRREDVLGRPDFSICEPVSRQDANANCLDRSCKKVKLFVASEKYTQFRQAANRGWISRPRRSLQVRPTDRWTQLLIRERDPLELRDRLCCCFGKIEMTITSISITAKKKGKG